MLGRCGEYMLMQRTKNYPFFVAGDKRQLTGLYNSHEWLGLCI